MGHDATCRCPEGKAAARAAAASSPAPAVMKVSPLNAEEVSRRFDYHAPSGKAQGIHSSLRREAKFFAMFLLDAIPDGRERALAMGAFEEATFWAHAAIARNPELHDNG